MAVPRAVTLRDAWRGGLHDAELVKFLAIKWVFGDCRQSDAWRGGLHDAGFVEFLAKKRVHGIAHAPACSKELACFAPFFVFDLSFGREWVVFAQIATFGEA
jgi:hypothetical protein